MKSGKGGNALAHTMTMGDDSMKKTKEKAYRLRFVLVEDRGEEIARNLARIEIEKVLAKYGAVSDNLDEVLSNYITGEMCNGEKR
ncbi:hypothetical protein [Brevibacillus borstelensis]